MNPDRTTLVILTPGFARDEADTTCIPTQQSFVKTLNKQFPGLNIIILAFEYPYEKKRYTWFANPVISFNGRNKGGFSRWRLRIAVQRELQRVHAENNIAGILSFWYGECALAGKRFSEKYGIRHFCWMWGQDVKRENKHARKGYLAANELIAFSDFLQDEFEKNHGIRPAHVITPGIDPGSFALKGESSDIDIMAAGSLIPLKQYNVFIEVIAEIKKVYPSVKAVLVGDGPQRAELQTLIVRHGLEANITFTGELSHPEVIRQMQRARLFLHPSSYEGFGIVCLEALCSGCEVISFTRPMKKETENWYIAATKEEMAAKALALLQDAKKIYKPVIPYTISESVKKMAELFSFS